MPRTTARRLRRYIWPRFWISGREHLGEGFFELTSETEAVELDERSNDDACLILLGEPGLGKTYAIDDAVRRAADSALLVHRVRLGAYDDGAALIGAIVDVPWWRGWLDSSATMHLYLDGLDEAMLHVKAITKRLGLLFEDLSADSRARLRLRISCRSAEWIGEFGEQLGELLGADPLELRLAPLREVDVRTAAQADGLGAEAFLAEVARLRIERLAANPLTLRMLLDDASTQSGRISESRPELFERASLRLLEEHDPARRRETAEWRLHVGQRLAVAERIAAAILLSAHAAITVDARDVSGGDVRTREIAGFVEQDADAAGDAAFEVNLGELAEVIGTAFFVDLGGGRFTFWHRVLGEFLAARYLLHHHMEIDQLMSLLASADHPEGRLIPELREVSAWVATDDRRVLDEVIARDPEVLLRNDALAVDDPIRAQIIAALLTDAAARRVNRWDQRSRAAYRTLRHPDVAEQLRRALRPDSSYEVRQAALTLAEIFQLPELLPSLLEIALDAQEPHELRDDAVWALKEYADRHAREALVTLAIEPIAHDVDDEIKGQALEVTFPSVLTAADVLAALTPPRNTHLIGMYRHFATTFPERLQAADLPVALAWAARIPVGDDADRLLTTVADGVLEASRPYVAVDAVLDGVVAVVMRRMDADAELIDRGEAEIFRDEFSRRRIVSRIIARHGTDVQRVTALTYTSPPLLLITDSQWLLEQTAKALGSAQEAAWARLAAWSFHPTVATVDAVFALVESSEVSRAAFAHFLGQVSLDSEQARHAARRAAKRQERESARDPEPIDREVLERLEAFEAGDIAAWWQLNVALATGPPDNEIESDLTALPAWERTPEDVRDRIAAGAVRYLEAQPTKTGTWFGTSRLDRPAFAAYRALLLLAKLRPDDLGSLATATWERWIPIVVHYPRSSGMADGGAHDLVLQTAATKCPKALCTWVLRAIDGQSANGDGHLFVLSRLRGFRLPALDAALVAKIGDRKLQAQALASLVDHVLVFEPTLGLQAAAPYLTTARSDSDRRRAEAVGAAAMRVLPGPTWPLLEPLFTAQPRSGVAIIEAVAHGDHADLGAQLDDTALAGLLDWLFTHVSPRDDPPVEPGAHWVSPRESAIRLRDRLVQVLAQRGTDMAVAAIERLAARHPTPAMDWHLHQARDAQLTRWRAPEPRHVVELAQRTDARIVLSTGHLQLAVMGSLRRLAARLKSGDPTLVLELWESSPPGRPKSEEALSTWVARQLNAELKVGGRLVGRELQVRENHTGKGRGESVDIVVSTPLGPRVAEARTAVVMIEAKGTWEKSVKTALSEQLTKRYLSVGTRHGIFLVFWFSREEWDQNDWRWRRWTKSLTETDALFESQAREVSAAGHVVVRSFVLDGSLPPAAPDEAGG